MDATDWLAVAGGVAAITAVNWWFFAAGRNRVADAGNEAGPQEVTVIVQGGYEPAAIRVRAGRPVRIVFDRRESSGCSEEVVFREFGVRRFLPPFAKTAVELTPAQAGEFEFTCGMGMLRGRLIVE